MNVLLAIALTLITCFAHASEYKQFYIDAGKHEIDPATAVISSIKGSEVYLCKSVESKVSKSGTSIGLKNVKKPKKEDVQ